MAYSTQAIVLKKISAGEADAIAVLYTRDFGKVRAYAQGVKKEAAKLKGHIESLSLVSVQFVIGTGGGERLTYAQMLEPWPSVRTDFNRYAAACYMVELVDTHCLSNHPDANIWNLLVKHFVELDRDHTATHDLLDGFEREFLASLGYGATNDMRMLGQTLARPSGMIYNVK